MNIVLMIHGNNFASLKKKLTSHFFFCNDAYFTSVTLLITKTCSKVKFKLPRLYIRLYLDSVINLWS